MKNNNVTLVGMPGAGKSTIGVLLAKKLGYGFLDSDLLIQQKEGRLLKEIIAAEGNERFKAIENKVNCEIDTSFSVIAPGGSICYCEEAMEHLKEISTIVYLEISLNGLKKRLGDLTARGVVFSEGQTLEDLYKERSPLYKKYADICVKVDSKSMGQVLDAVYDRLMKEKTED